MEYWYWWSTKINCPFTNWLLWARKVQYYCKANVKMAFSVVLGVLLTMSSFLFVYSCLFLFTSANDSCFFILLHYFTIKLYNWKNVRKCSEHPSFIYVPHLFMCSFNKYLCAPTKCWVVNKSDILLSWSSVSMICILSDLIFCGYY